MLAINELRAAMARKEYSMNDLADILGVSRSTIYRRMSGESEFTVTEVIKMIDVLNITDPERVFFA